MVTELIAFGFTAKQAPKWIKKLWSSLKKIREQRNKELEAINDEVLEDPELLARYYVEPDCQEFNPADHDVQDFMINREPILVKVDEFFRTQTRHTGSNQLFILSDAGMGKTSLLVMLKLLHLTRFWPNGKTCVLKKLGNKTLDDIGAIEGKLDTILLLDSLDEDPAAYGNVRDRLLLILRATQHFYRVIITCRTQFFPKTDKDPFERPGRVVIEEFNCYAKYLSYFSDQKVSQYLSKCFPRKFGILEDTVKIDASRKIIHQMGSLRCRPMLLAYIEDLRNSPLLKRGGGEYQIYNALVDNWIRREKPKERKDRIIKEELLHACIILAFVMSIQKVRDISEKQLNRIGERISKIKKITQVQLKGRSLLNKNSDGDYRFSHRSIQEFLVARFLIEEDQVFDPEKLIPYLLREEGCPKLKIPVTDLMFKMIAQSGKQPRFMSLLDFDGLTLKEADLKDIKPTTAIIDIVSGKAKIPAGTPVINSLGMTFVYIPSGEFMMGSPDDEKERDSDEQQHHVRLTKGFLMQTTPVTQGQWKSVMGNNPSFFKDSGDGCPVERVSWHDACKFIDTLNQMEKTEKYRLPTEAEWEYACRAGTSTRFYTGNTHRDLARAGWYRKNSGGKTHPVGSKAPNAWGLYDMHGNVWERCHDWYGKYPPDSIINPTGPESGSGRVVRGGSWDVVARNCRSACRYDWHGADDRYFLVGFRLVRSLPF